jgi:hypothetical protein
MATSCTDFDHPVYHLVKNLEYGKVPEYLMSKEGVLLKHISLGEALDFSSAGGGNFCGWRMKTRQMVEFIKFWMDAQRPRIKYERIPLGDNCFTTEEKSREYSYEWNKFPQRFTEELPFINYPSCPRNDNHGGVLSQKGGVVRCAHVDVKKMRPDFIKELGTHFDSLSRTSRINFTEDTPQYNSSENEEEDGYEWKLYLGKKALFDSQEPTERIIDPCYAIISDKGTYLPLETVLNRISVNDHSEELCFPFSGFTVANYVGVWYNQKGEREFFARQEDHYRHFPDFRPMSCDD